MSSYRVKLFSGCLAVLACWPTLTGCNAPDRSGVTTARESQSTKDAEGENSQSTSASSASNASASKRPEPIIEPDALNEDGQIVLTGPADDGKPSVTEDDSSVSRRADGQGQSSADDSKLTSSNSYSASVDQLETTTASAVSVRSVTATEQLPVEANVVSDSEREQVIAPDWPKPQAVLFVSGQQHGYLEPCGCTGLERQKGGLIRRDTLITSLRDRGWDVVPLDVGNQVRRIGRQAELKFQATVTAFKTMGYRAATLGLDDLKLSSIELIQTASSDGINDSAFIASSLTVLDPSFFPESKVVEAGGRKIGIAAVFGQEYSREIQSDDIAFADPISRGNEVVKELIADGCDFIVLLCHASLDESRTIARGIANVDVVVTSGGNGEPTLYPEKIEGSKAVMVQVGTKGMYGGIVGLFADETNPIRYQKIAITSQFKDSKRLLAEFAQYQERLKEEGLAGLGVAPIPHPTERKFVGTESCGDCHTTAYEIWKGTPHSHATESIVNPPNDRGGIARHFDPECISCHVTGWNPQRFYPYQSGYIGLEESAHLVGNGCENCHGPGSNHVAAENGDIEADDEMMQRLRDEMKLPLASAREKCLECHDLDNSPDFHLDGAFEKYWEQVKHVGKD